MSHGSSSDLPQQSQRPPRPQHPRRCTYCCTPTHAQPPLPHLRAHVRTGKHKKRKTIVFSSKLLAIENMADHQVHVGDEEAHEKDL